MYDQSNNVEAWVNGLHIHIYSIAVGPIGAYPENGNKQMILENYNISL
jgi:hypothetical protein